MVKRTPEFVAAALKLLPPRPDAGIALAEEEEEGGEERYRYEEEDVYKDLVAYGRVVGPPEDGGVWEQVWRAAPLLIDDDGVLGAIESLTPDLIHVCDEVSTATIGGVLQEHPGPVGSLWIDSPSDGHLEAVGEWMDTLRATRGENSLRELVVLNTMGPKNRAFPLRRLPGGIRRLSLGFFAVNPLDGDHLTNIVELRLLGCNFDGKELSALVQDLCSLTVLVLGSCQLTRGCGPAGLVIVSCSLKNFKMWHCTASGGVQLQYTPSLCYICTDVRPRDGRLLRFDMRAPLALRELWSFDIGEHEVTFITPREHATWRYGRRIATLPYLASLGIEMEMAGSRQILELVNLLYHLPRLTVLLIKRKDNVSPAEARGFQESLTVPPCIANSLQHLTMEEFRGGGTEIAFATHILAGARNLTSLLLRCHQMLKQDQATAAAAPMMACPRASAECEVGLRFQ